MYEMVLRTREKGDSVDNTRTNGNRLNKEMGNRIC